MNKYLGSLTNKKVLIILALVGFFVYFNSFFNGFAWDDFPYVLLNPDLRLFNAASLFGNSTFNSIGQYRPLSTLYFFILYSLFKNSAFFYHLLQLLLHVANGILVYFLFRKFLKKEISLFLSLIFIVHPVNVESVSFISSSNIPLSFLLGAAAVLFFINKNVNKKTVLISSVLLLLSVFAKEDGFILLMMLLIYTVLYQRNKISAVLLSGLSVTSVYLLTRIGLGKILIENPDIVPIAQLTLYQRLINIPAIIFYYLKTFVLPTKLAIMQYWVVIAVDFENFYLPLLLDLFFISIIFFTGIHLFQKNKKMFFAFLFFFVWFASSVFLHLQIVPLDMTVAERWFYLPLVGILGMIGVIIESIELCKQNLRTPLYTVLSIFFILLSVRTVVRNSNWRDSLTLYLHDIQINDNFNLENNLGVEYFNRHEYDKSLYYSLRSVEKFAYASNLYNLGSDYGVRGDITNAREYYYKAINTPDYSETTHKNILLHAAKILISNDTPAESKKYVETLLLKYPESPDLWADLAICEYYIKNQDKAITAAYKAMILSNNNATNYLYNLILNKGPESEVGKIMPENFGN